MKTAEINSMTGFGSAVFEAGGDRFTLELRSLNSRHLDVRVRLPWPEAKLESLLLSATKKGLHRGRVEIAVRAGGPPEADRNADTLVTVEGGEPEETPPPEPGGPLAERFRQAHAELTSLCVELGLTSPLQARDVIAFMGAREHEVARQTPHGAPPDFSAAALSALSEAREGLQATRRREGKLMALAIGEQLAEAASKVSEIERIAAEQPQRLGERLRERVTHTLEALGHTSDALDAGRLTAEIATHVDRADVTEELVRLRAHFAHFAEIMAGDPPHGRKLDFLLQEMFREINTTGAKSPDSRSSNLVVDVKSVFEKIREVVQNVE